MLPFPRRARREANVAQSNDGEMTRSGIIGCFAYGSNLDTQQVRRRLGRVPLARVACLKGWRLAFNKGGDPVYANIVPAPGEEVWGVLYECTAEELARMDRFEGVPSGHYRRVPVMVTAGGDEIRAEAYVACEDRVVAEQSPPKAYAARILNGAREHGLPDEYVRKLRHLCQGGAA